MTEPDRAYRAFLIGNQEFPDDPKLQSLRGPATDLSELRAALTDPVTGMPWEVTEVLDWKSRDIVEALQTFFEQAGRDDQLLLYYSGHGVCDRGELHLCALDTTDDRLLTRAVRHPDIETLMADCSAQAIVVVLDCCFSGTATTKGFEPAALLQGRGRFVMTSCGQIETAADAPEAGRPSPFTEHLVAGLRDGAIGDDGFVAVEDVYRYVDRCLRGSGQRPGFRADSQAGRVHLARRARKTRKPEFAGGHQNDSLADMRPWFTDGRGNAERAEVGTHFSGILHVKLPKLLGTLSVHHDQFSGARCGRGATVLHLPSDGTAAGRSWLAGESADGSGVLFKLPHDAGTVTWSADQLSYFDALRINGRWPTTAGHQQDAGTRVLLKSVDPAYRALSSEVRTQLIGCVCGLICGGLLLLLNALFHGGAGSLLWLLAILFLTTGVGAGEACRGALSRLIRIRDLVSLPGPAINPVVMQGWVKPSAPSAAGPNGDVVYLPSQARIVVWSKYYRLTMPADGYRSGIEKGVPPFDSEGPVPVEVVGSPGEGHWVVIRTPDGILWPSGRAERCLERERTELIGESGTE
ncbi:caspase domain-containing protein [Streptomyces sp. NPDC092903]|uniref:caspase family protein n=1 Tax=Streptomyces sp. NPDC092903 TaxID=3366017 RepID=UPI00382764C1